MRLLVWAPPAAERGDQAWMRYLTFLSMDGLGEYRMVSVLLSSLAGVEGVNTSSRRVPIGWFPRRPAHCGGAR